MCPGAGGAGEGREVGLGADGEAAGAAAAGVGVEEGAVYLDRAVAGAAGAAGHVEPGDGLAGGGEDSAAEHEGGEEGVGVAVAAVAVDRDGAVCGFDGGDEAVEHLSGRWSFRLGKSTVILTKSIGPHLKRVVVAFILTP